MWEAGCPSPGPGARVGVGHASSAGGRRPACGGGGGTALRSCVSQSCVCHLHLRPHRGKYCCFSVWLDPPPSFLRTPLLLYISESV